MDMQQAYDELEEIIEKLDILVDDISQKYYIDQLNDIKYQAMDELEEVQAELQKEYDREEEEMNRQFINERI